MEATEIKYVVSYLNGLTVSKYDKEHAIETAKIFTTYTKTGSVTLFPGTDLYKAPKVSNLMMQPN